MNTNKSPRVLGIIPARGGSKGIPGKNTIDLCGKPLIYYSIRESSRASSLDAVLVSTDSEDIARIAQQHGADVPFLRPAEISGDNARDIEFLAHTLAWVEEHRGWKPDILAYLPPTVPTRTAEDIDRAIAYMDETGCDSVRTMVYAPHFNPYKMWIENGDENRILPLFPEGSKAMPRQQFKQFYMPVGAVYATRAKLVNKGILWGQDTRKVDFPLERFVDIDTPADLQEAARIIEEMNG